MARPPQPGVALGKPIAGLAFALMLPCQPLTAQPYAGTIFIDPDIITASDPTTLASISYAGQGLVTVYDRRPPGWVTINAYLFDVVWSDGLTCVAMVNPEFGSVAAATFEANRYAEAVGRIPTCLRADVNELWIHAGVYAFGGGNSSILIHTGRGEEYIASGILEETLVHEATHTSLDAAHAAAPGWVAAQQADPNFISTYAAANPTTEDLAESYLCWLAVRHRASRISAANYSTILATIPNRLAYFDAMPCDLFPITSGAGLPGGGTAPTVFLYPSPAHGRLHVRGGRAEGAGIRIELMAPDGRLVLSSPMALDGTVDISHLAPGLHLWRCVDRGAVMGSGTIVIE